MKKIKGKITGIPEEVKKQVSEIVRHFNANDLKGSDCYYETRYEGKLLYLDRREGQEPCPICRLKYMGKIDDWEFAIYKYSKGGYDSDEWFFPGMGEVDGTMEGAMKAGMKAYPVSI